ncbi:hypothetical protein ANCCAN_29963 [Ancylostoma caninum]|uniref:G-protein coupled receptors family 1 profile domain-containing protein n=1 Tax=Ancylostoma caninum TaxID=29170 RepID=A0A368EX57_ANCCA|nr:hypothetical protein ANCCAN_29963 [Ancylostoma caninum]
MFSSTPLTIQLKIKLTLTVAIALQRALALFLPVFYRKLCSSSYATASLILGITLGCIDLFLEFALSPIVESPNCGTIGCFVSDSFLYYWGTSNMVSDLYSKLHILYKQVIPSNNELSSFISMLKRLL